MKYLISAIVLIGFGPMLAGGQLENAVFIILATYPILGFFFLFRLYKNQKLGFVGALACFAITYVYLIGFIGRFQTLRLEQFQLENQNTLMADRVTFLELNGR